MTPTTEYQNIKLSSLKTGDKCSVSSIVAEDPKTVRKFSSLGIIKGANIKVKKSGNPMVLEVAGTEMALGKKMAAFIEVDIEIKKIVLVGNPNAGKSAVFSRLTGVKAVSSNFPGTTVALRQSTAQIGDKNFVVYDVPGVYSLEAHSKADEEAVEIIKSKKYDLAVCVLDAMHLERSLFFALEVMTLNVPVIFLVNKSESSKTKGINIDSKTLHRALGVPAVSVEALTGEGFKRAERAISRMVHFVKIFVPRAIPETDQGKWELIGQISKTAQTLKHKHPTLLETLAEYATHPVAGIIIALFVLTASFFTVMKLGEGLINLLTPLYENFYLPFITSIFHGDGFIATVMVGDGTQNSLGILTDALQIALIDVMSYVLVFYALLEFLADLGYLPRLSVLLDSLLHKIGIHGYGAIPIMMGLGCKVPAIMGVRTLESRREKFIATVLVLMLAPCISQSAMIISILSPHGLKYILLVFSILLISGIFAGAMLNNIMKGNPPEMFMEVPSWQKPKLKEWATRVWYRMKEYLFDAVPLIIIGVLFINVAHMTGVLDFITKISQTPLQFLFGLPGETASIMILGFLRKDVSIALLEPFKLAPAQLVVACVFMTMYVPCVATFFVMLKESGIKDTLKIVLLTLCCATLMGALTHMLFKFF